MNTYTANRLARLREDIDAKYARQLGLLDELASYLGGTKDSQTEKDLNDTTKGIQAKIDPPTPEVRDE